MNESELSVQYSECTISKENSSIYFQTKHVTNKDAVDSHLL